MASVGLQIFVDLPKTGLVAFIQRRGNFTYEDFLKDTKKGIRRKVWPGAYQTTVHGGLNKDEFGVGGVPCFLAATIRETKEELGKDAFTCLLVTGQFQNMVELYRDGDETGAIVVYGLYLSADFWAKMNVRLELDSGGMDFLCEQDLDKIKDLEISIDKKMGVIDRFTVAMFHSDLTAIKKGFAMIKEGRMPKAEL